MYSCICMSTSEWDNVAEVLVVECGCSAHQKKFWSSYIPLLFWSPVKEKYFLTLDFFKTSSSKCHLHTLPEHSIVGVLLVLISLWRKRKEEKTLYEGFHTETWWALTPSVCLFTSSVSQLFSSCSSYHNPPLCIWPTTDKSCSFKCWSGAPPSECICIIIVC